MKHIILSLLTMVLSAGAVVPQQVDMFPREVPMVWYSTERYFVHDREYTRIGVDQSQEFWMTEVDSGYIKQVVILLAMFPEPIRYGNGFGIQVESSGLTDDAQLECEVICSPLFHYTTPWRSWQASGTVDSGQTYLFRSPVGEDVGNWEELLRDYSDLAGVYVVLSANLGERMNYVSADVIWYDYALAIPLRSPRSIQPTVSVVPNPAVSTLHVTGAVSDYQIIDLLGRRVGAGAMRGGDVHVEGLPSGHYFLTFPQQGIAVPFMKVR